VSGQFFDRLGTTVALRAHRVTRCLNSTGLLTGAGGGGIREERKF